MASFFKATLVTAVAACTLAMTASAASAQVVRPWWHMAVGSRPSVITPGAGKELEVQEINTEANSLGYDVFELEVEGAVVGIFGSEATVAFGIPLANGYNVQKALETNAAYSHAGITVGGGPAPASLQAKTNGTVPSITVVPLYGTGEAKVVAEGRVDGKIVALAANLGDAPAEGGSQPISIAAALPPGVEAVWMEGKTVNPSVERGPVNCAVSALTCEFDGQLPAYEAIEVEVLVGVREGAQSGEEVSLRIEGGGAHAGSGSLKLAYGSVPAFGVQSYQMSAEGEGGEPVTQAGAHPYQLTTTEVLDQGETGEPPQLPKDLEFELPPGLLGNPTAVPQCSLGEFLEIVQEPLGDECRPDTAIGAAMVTLKLKDQIETFSVPVFNLEPEEGEPARFGFYPTVPVVLDTSVRTGVDYGVTVSSHNITQLVGLLSVEVTFWGVPGSPTHDHARGWGCLKAAQGASGYTCKPQEQRNPPPFLSMPTSCSGDPLLSTEYGDSWRRVSLEPVDSTLPALVGCNKERFEPTIKTTPDDEEASRPSGLAVDVHVPQELQTVAEGTSESEVEKIEVALPRGVTLNPGGAGGLQACTQEEIGLLKAGVPGAVGGLEFTSSKPSCPKQAKIGTAVIHTPLLPNPLQGAIYLAQPDPLGPAELGDNPFNSLIAMYLVAEDPVSGVLVKLPMHVSLDEATGQVTATVENPELPFEDAALHFFGGGRAPLATPGLCGAYTTKAVFTPWSGNPPVESASTLNITSGPNGSSCPSNPKPFTPEFNAGMTNINAGGYSELRMTMGHPDVDQALGALHMVLPPGVMGSLTRVKLCPEPQASEGTCGTASLIGHTTVTAGLGATPAIVARPGNVYITTGYKGAPYGLSIANPAETGPFDLEKGTPCNCIVVRAKVEVDPLTAQLKITSDPLPSMLKGIPLDLQHVSVQIDRPNFAFNPTNCAPTTVTGSLTGAEGAVAPLSEYFQVANCAPLGFKPKFTASTAGKTSRKKGASLNVKLAYPKAAFGTQANIKSVHVELPKALPSRLSTLNHACLDSVFNQDPASCPSQSRVGFAKAVTPVLPVPLEGSAYFVSHGGQRFPELIVVLQGYGVTIYLQGETFISKAGITSSTFKGVPDVPVGSFELTLPEGPYSALAVNRNLCTASLSMSTAFQAQNGATLSLAGTR